MKSLRLWCWVMLFLQLPGLLPGQVDDPDVGLNCTSRATRGWGLSMNNDVYVRMPREVAWRILKWINSVQRMTPCFPKSYSAIMKLFNVPFSQGVLRLCSGSYQNSIAGKTKRIAIKPSEMQIRLLAVTLEYVHILTNIVFSSEFRNLLLLYSHPTHLSYGNYISRNRKDKQTDRENISRKGSRNGKDERKSQEV